MPERTILEFLHNLFIKAQIFIARIDVQIQLFAIVAILVGTWFVSKMIIILINKFVAPRFAVDDQQEKGKTAIGQRLLPGLRVLVFPILALVTTNLVLSYLLNQGLVVGLVRLLLFILWVFLFYLLFLSIMYGIFGEKPVRRFHRRLFVPLFALFVAYQIFILFIDIEKGSDTVLSSTSENPLTLGALFLATIGLYFWVDATLGVKHIIFHIITKYTSTNPGQLDAALTLSSYVLLAIGLLFAISLLGVNTTTFAAITAGLSVGIGFGLQSIIGNFVSGIILLFEGSIRPGDYIEADNTWAEVKKLSIRSTLVKTFDGYEVITDPGGTVIGIIPTQPVPLPGIPTINIPDVSPPIPPGGNIIDGNVVDENGRVIAPARIGNGLVFYPVIKQLPPLKELLEGNVPGFTQEEVVFIIDCIQS